MGSMELGRFGDRRLEKGGALLLERMVGRKSVCLRRLAGGRRREIVRFGRFLANPRVTVEHLIEGWGEQAAAVCAGRHILAIQDTSEFNFRTTAERRRGLGEIGKGVGRGLLLHAMLAVDAETRGCLGLVSGRIWTRPGRRSVPHAKRPLVDKESERWLSTAEAAKGVLAAAASVTVVADRESDIYTEWARLPGPRFHLLTRAMHDRTIAEGGRLSTACLVPAGEGEIGLVARTGRPARQAKLAARFGRVSLKRPGTTRAAGLPKTVSVSLDDAAKAERLLRNLARRLEHDAPGVSGSILEGLDEILTVIRLGLPPQLRHSLACTNAIENAIGTVRTVQRNVKRWRNAEMALRWTAAGLLEAQKTFRRLKAYRQLPVLDAALREAVRKAGAKSVIEDIEVAA